MKNLPDQELRDLLSFIEEVYTPSFDHAAFRAEQDAAYDTKLDPISPNFNINRFLGKDC